MPQNECARSPRPALYLSLALALSLFLSFALPAKCVLMFSKETQNFASGNAAQHLKYLSTLLGSCRCFHSVFVPVELSVSICVFPTPLLCVVCVRIIFLTLLLDFFTSE